MDDQMRETVAPVSGQIEEMIRRMDATSVFGEPIQKGDVTLIPVASVSYAFGSGQGWGRGPQQDKAATETSQTGEGGGAGGGAGGMARPLGYIRIDREGAHWEPIMDMTRVSVGGMLLGGWIVFWVMKMIRTVSMQPRRR